MIDIVKLANGNVAIYDNSTSDFISMLSPDIVEIECNTNGNVKVIQDNGNVEYFEPSMVANTQVLPAAAIPFTGTCADLGLLLSTDFFFDVSGGPVFAEIQLAASDETTALTAGTAKVTFRMPYAMTLTAVRASLTTAQTSGSIFTVDINQGGSSVLGTKLTIDNTEKTSVTAATAATITTSALTDDAEITIDIDQIGDGTATGLKITIIGTI
jgi:hypothetical protein